MRPTFHQTLAALLICLTLAALLPAYPAPFAASASPAGATPLSPCSITEPPPPPPPPSGLPGARRPASPATWAQPVLFKDINPNISDTPSDPTRFMTVGNLTYFIAVEHNIAADLWLETIASVGLWRTDGTAAGTFKLKTIDYNGNFLTPYDYPLEKDGWVYFFVHGGQYKRQLWRTDGTLAGTTLFAGDFREGCSGVAGELTSFQDGFFFAGNLVDGTTGHELWHSDGTVAGTRVFKDLAPGPDSSYVQNLVKVGEDQLYFTTFITDVIQLWHSDGTVTGTLPIKSLSRQSVYNYQDFHAISLGDRLLMALYTPEHGAELWISDGTAAGTMLVKDISPGAGSSWIDDFAAAGDAVYFSATTAAYGNELWVTRGTSATTTLVADLIPGYVSSNPYGLTAFNDRVLFNATTYEHGRELWGSDGTAAGTTLVKDILAGVESGNPVNLTVLGADLYFTAAMSATQLMLWKTGGTTASTQPVAPICAGSVCQNLYLDGSGMARLGERLVLGGANDAHGHEPWLVNLNTPAAGLIKNISVTGVSSHPGDLTEIDGRLFFTAWSKPAGSPASSELWVSDGAAAGTIKIKDFTDLGSLYDHNGAVIFSASDGVSGAELWRSDGTVSGTFQLKDADPGSASSTPDRVAQMDQLFFFTASDAASGRELWRTDGTISGTFRLKDIRPGISGSSILIHTQVGGVLFFDVDDGVSGLEPWRTDGTITGTFRLKDIRPGGQSSLPTPRSLASLDATVFFAADDGVSGTEVWLTDGTSDGTRQLRDINPGSADAAPRFLPALSDTLLFNADDGVNGSALWRSDGTISGTLQVMDLSPAAETVYLFGDTALIGDQLVFSTYTAGGVRRLWRSDGTAEGTVVLKEVADGMAVPSVLTVQPISNSVFFLNQSQDGMTKQLWISDGSAAGTIQIGALPDKSALSSFVTHTGRLFFIVSLPSGESQLWQSDGTPAGTHAISPSNGKDGDWAIVSDLTSVGTSLFMTISDNQGKEPWIYDSSGGLRRWMDIAPGASHSAPQAFVPVGDQLFFTANDTVHGRELWHSGPLVIPPSYTVYMPMLRR